MRQFDSSSMLVPSTFDSIHVQELVAAQQHPHVARQRGAALLVPGDAGGLELLAASLEVLPSPARPPPPSPAGRRRGGGRSRSRSASSLNASPTRTANLSACSWTSGSFIMNSAWIGVVLSGRVGGGGVGVGAVEDRQERVLADPLLHQVDAAAVRLVHRRRTACAACTSTPLSAGTGAARRRRAVERAADGQHRVADLLGREPPRVEPPEQVVVRVERSRCRVVLRSTSW